MGKNEEPKYSRNEIADQEKRSKAIEGIRADNKWVDKTKSAEGKKELSQTWLNKANLSPEQKKAVCDELLVKDIDSETPKELERRVKALQKHLWFADKDCDGILGWKTLEKVDKMIEDQHNLEDEERGEKRSDKLGLARIAEEEDWEKKGKQEKEKKNLEWLAFSTDPQDYYSNWDEPKEDPYKLAEIAKSKLPQSVNDLWLTETANDLKLWKKSGKVQIENGQFFSVGEKWYQVTGLEQFADGTFRIFQKEVGVQWAIERVYAANYLSEQGIQKFENEDSLLASIRKEELPVTASQSEKPSKTA